MTASIFERFGDLLDYLASALLKSLGMRDTKERAILNIRLAMSKEGATRYYNALPEELRNDPNVQYAYQLKTADLEKEEEAQKSLIEEIAEGVVEAYKPLGTRIAKTYMEFKSIPIATAYETAVNLVALDFAKDVSIGIAGLALETGSAGQINTMTDFFKFFKSKTGYGGAITMLMKHPVEMALLRPMKYAFHSQFRNELPPLWDIADMDVKGNLAATSALTGFASGIFGIGKPSATNKDIFNAVGGYEGYEQWYLDAKWDSRWRELRLGEIAWALSDSLVDDTQLDRMLGYAKYAPADRVIIIKFIKARYLRPYRDRVATQFRNEYKEGYISAQEFRLKLAGLEIPLPVRNLMIFEADALFRLDMYADQIVAWEAQYLKTPTMTDAELRALYSTIIVDPARIEPRIAKVRAQRSKTPALPKPVTQGVKVSSRPSWAQISLDYVDTGKLTPETVETSIGEHKLTIIADGYEPYREDFSVKEGEFVEIYAVLIPLPETAE